MELRENRDRLVEAMLPHAAFDGWSAVSMEAAARDLGLSPREVARLFPHGPIDAVAHFVALADRRMAEDFAARPRGNRVGDRVFAAIQARLDRWAAHREAIRRALALLALPAHLPLAGKLAWDTADAIWRTVGDHDKGAARLTKRASLAAIQSSTLLFWLDDDSENAIETWSFLRRRLDEIQALPRLRQTVGRKADGALGGLLGRLRPARRHWAVTRRAR